MMFNSKILRIVLLGLGFMLLFSAFQTQSNIQQTMINSIKADDKDFKGDGYTSLAIVYTFFAISNWAAPSTISIIGPIYTMSIGTVAYVLFIMSFLIPLTWLLYLMSAIMGIGAALLWTGQGNYMTLNSSQETISRDSGIFWALFQLSYLIGNTFVYFQFKGLDSIDKTTRTVVSWTLSVVGIAGVIVLVLLPRSTKKYQVDGEAAPGPLKVLKSSAKLSITKNMLLLSVTFLYEGIATTFITGVYGSCVGFTMNFPSPKELVGLSGMLIGVGQVIGGAAFGILASKTSKWGRNPIVIGGFIINIVVFVLIFLNLPNDSPFDDTNSDAIISSNHYLAMLCSLLLGFGDACFNTQILSILGGAYPEKSAAAFAIFHFVKSVASAVSFGYTPYLILYGQLGILIIFAIVGTICFVIVERAMEKAALKEETINK